MGCLIQSRYGSVKPVGPSIMCGYDRRFLIYVYRFCLDVPSHVWMEGVGLGVACLM